MPGRNSPFFMHGYSFVDLSTILTVHLPRDRRRLKANLPKAVLDGYSQWGASDLRSVAWLTFKVRSRVAIQ